jgi:hypothetical protein
MLTGRVDCKQKDIKIRYRTKVIYEYIAIAGFENKDRGYKFTGIKRYRNIKARSPTS